MTAGGVAVLLLAALAAPGVAANDGGGGAIATGLALGTAGPVAQDGDEGGTGAPTEGILSPEGFTALPWAAIGAPTTLEWGPDDRLYVMTITGQVVTVEPGPLGLLGVVSPFYELPPPATAIGIATDPDEPGLVYLSEWYAEDGHNWGRVWSVADTTGDGRGDARELMVDRLPGGQHFVQDLEVHPVDGRLYFTNGSLTDNGLECATPDERAWTILNVEGDCPQQEVQWSGALLSIDRDARDLVPGDDGLELVSGGMRNPYGFAFWPPDPSLAYLPENGPSDPYGDDVLRVTDVHDGQVDDHGFPSCLINPAERGNPLQEMLSGLVGEGPYDNTQSLAPQQSPDEDVIEVYGTCNPDEVAWPVALFEPHAAVTGAEFAHGSGFTGTYGNDLFVAQSGSHDLAAPTAGHDVVRINFRDDGTIVTGEDGLAHIERFAIGGTPVDLTFGPDGAMYVADTNLGVIRIAWTGGAEPPDDEGDDRDDPRRCPPSNDKPGERPGHGNGPPVDEHPGQGRGAPRGEHPGQGNHGPGDCPNDQSHRDTVMRRNAR